MGPGLGPGGAQLYPVAWLREPYDSELSPYLATVKRIPPGASADIACQMAAYNRVENCQILAFNFTGKYAEYEYLGSLIARNLPDGNSTIILNMLKAYSISINDLLKNIWRT